MKQENIKERSGAAETFLEEIDDKYLEETIRYSERKRKPNLNMALRFAACLAVAAVLAVSSLTVATAAGSLRAYEMLYHLDPYLAEKMSPVVESCVDQDIEMKVAGIYLHENIADIYVTMRDLTGERLDDTADLFDSYSIRTNCDQWGGCTLVDFDEETCTATFLIKVGLVDQKIEGKKMTFRVTRFLSGKQKVEKNLPEILPGEMIGKEVDFRPEKEILQMLNSRSLSEYAGLSTGLDKLLAPNEEQRFSPVNGATITAYGIVDGKFHVQVYYENIHERDDHGDIQLIDQNGIPHLRDGVAYFWDANRVGRYEEYEFDIPEEELTEYTVFCYFSTGAKLYEGEWEISFPIRITE